MVWTREENEREETDKESYGLQINKEKEKRNIQKNLDGGYKQGYR